MLDKRRLQQMQREGGDFLLVNPVGRDFTALAEEDEAVGAIPVFDDIESLVDFSTECLLSKIAAQEYRLNRAARLRKSLRRQKQFFEKLPLMRLPFVKRSPVHRCGSCLSASIPAASVFKCGREFAAWMGLVPRQFSTGGNRDLAPFRRRVTGVYEHCS